MTNASETLRQSFAQQQFNTTIENLKQDFKGVPHCPENWGRKSMPALEKLAELKIFNHPDTAIIIENVIKQLSESNPFNRELINNITIEIVGKRDLLNPQYVISSIEEIYKTQPISQNFTPQDDVIQSIINSQPNFNLPKPNQPIEKLDPHQFFIHLGAQMLLIEYPQLAYPLIEKLKKERQINSQTPGNFDFNNLLSVQDKDTVTTNFIALLNHNQLVINPDNLETLIA